MSGNVTQFPRKMYYILLKGPKAGLPVAEPEGECIAAMGGKISRKAYPVACSVLEGAVGQQRFVMKQRGKVRSWLVSQWNGFISDHMVRHPWLLRLYRDRMKQNPKWNREYLIAPDAGKIDQLELMLKLGTRGYLEPKGMDFD